MTMLASALCHLLQIIGRHTVSAVQLKCLASMIQQCVVQDSEMTLRDTGKSCSYRFAGLMY